MRRAERRDILQHKSCRRLGCDAVGYGDNRLVRVIRTSRQHHFQLRARAHVERPESPSRLVQRHGVVPGRQRHPVADGRDSAGFRAFRHLPAAVGAEDTVRQCAIWPLPCQRLSSVRRKKAGVIDLGVIGDFVGGQLGGVVGADGVDVASERIGGASHAVSDLNRIRSRVPVVLDSSA